MQDKIQKLSSPVPVKSLKDASPSDIARVENVRALYKFLRPQNHPPLA